MNRKNAFFRKHALNTKAVSTSELAHKILQEQFGFVRIRRSLQERVLRLIETVIENQKTFDYSYYLQKNAPLPPNWSTRKGELQTLAADPA